eukprot:2905518-Amphidinium_carterae.1
MMIWFERVPSASNVADNPSRVRQFVAPQGWEPTEVWPDVGKVFPFSFDVGLSGWCGLGGVL